jgi:uncharacterized protein YjbJ (UPF0337 family)
MNNVEIKGEINQIKGRQEQKEASRTGDRLKCIEGKEKELAGLLQKELGKDEESVLKAMDRAEEE